MTEVTKELYKVIQRCHKCTPKFKGDGDLANVEFFMLISLAALLDMKNGRCCGEEIIEPSTENEEGITLKEFIEASGMSMSAASKKISIFEKKGYVKREPSVFDRRNVQITLTPKGKEICEKEKQKKRRWAKALIEGMGEDDMKQLLYLANKAFDVLDEVVQNE